MRDLCAVVPHQRAMTINETKTKQKSGLRKLANTIALFLFVALIIWWFSRGLDWTEVRTSIRSANWELLSLAVAIVSSTYLLRAYRWRALLKHLAKPQLKDLFISNVVGFSAFFVLGRAGEVVRPALLSMRDRRVKPAASFITIFMERICDFVAIVLLFAVNLLWFKPQLQESIFGSVQRVGLVLLIAITLGLATLVLFERNAKWLIRVLENRLAQLKFVPEVIRRAITSVLRQLATALRVVAYPRDLMVTVLWTAALWFAIVIGNLLMIRAFGISFGMRETIFVLGWALLGSLVPTPGGAAGAFHAAAAAGLIFLGVTKELATAIAIVIHLVDFAPALVFGLYYLLRGEITLGRLREINGGSEEDLQSLKSSNLASETL
jgi:glycosyltransferase 2 family protein